MRRPASKSPGCHEARTYNSSTDGNEYDNYFDPLDNTNYPMTDNRGYVAAANVNSNGAQVVPAEWFVYSVVSIDPGVTLKFASGAKLSATGLLLVRGTELEPVTFTSIQSVPQPGDWKGVATSAGGARLEHFTISYTGDPGALQLSSNAHYSFIDNGTFTDNSTLDQNHSAGVHYNQSSYHLMTNSVFDNNLSNWRYAAGVWYTYSVNNRLLDSTFSNNTAAGNTSSGGVSYN